MRTSRLSVAQEDNIKVIFFSPDDNVKHSQEYDAKISRLYHGNIPILLTELAAIFLVINQGKITVWIKHKKVI
jgi:hypothetical protein